MHDVVTPTRKQTKPFELVICYLPTSSSPVQTDQDWERYRLYPAERCLRAMKCANLACSLLNKSSGLV